MTLDEWLLIFSDEMEQVKSRSKDIRVFSLKDKEKKGQLSNLMNKDEPFCFLCLYNPQLIEIYYDREAIQKDYLNDPDVNDETLEKIFRYLAHHEYGHALFSESTEYIKTFFQDKMKNRSENLESLIINRVFNLSKEFFADYQAKRIDSHLPKYELNRVFKGVFPKFHEIKINVIEFNHHISHIDLTSLYYRLVLFLSISFYVFDEWDNFFGKWSERTNPKLLEILFYINKIYEKLINYHLNLEKYWEILIRLANILKKIDYFELILKNNLEKDIIIELDDFLHSL